MVFPVPSHPNYGRCRGTNREMTIAKGVSGMTMTKKGFSHIGLSTLDLDKTREFYEDILGFKPVRCDTIKIKEGGEIRHIFFDTGRDQLLAFMEAKGEVSVIHPTRSPIGALPALARLRPGHVSAMAPK